MIEIFNKSLAHILLVDRLNIIKRQLSKHGDLPQNIKKEVFEKMNKEFEEIKQTKELLMGLPFINKKFIDSINEEFEYIETIYLLYISIIELLLIKTTKQ